MTNNSLALSFFEVAKKNFLVKYFAEMTLENGDNCCNENVKRIKW